MAEIMYIIVITLLGFGGAILLRFKQLGMTRSEAVVKTIQFPFQITSFHIKMFKMNSEEPFIVRMKILLMPLFNLSEVLVSYAYACIETTLEKEAVLTLLSQVKEDEKENLIKKLVKKGYLIENKKSSNSIMEVNRGQYKVATKSDFYKMNLKVS